MACHKFKFVDTLLPRAI